MPKRTLGVIVCVFLWTPGYAQTLGTITGEVKDTSGAVIPGATVTAQNAATNAVRIQNSNEAGAFTFPAMPPGDYTVKAELQGFKTAQNKVELHVEQSVRVSFTLEVGGITETTEVTGTSPLISTENATIGTVIDNRRIVELPLNGRNYLSLIAASPNVSVGFAGAGQAGDRQGGSRSAQQYSIAGQRREFNYFTLDGVDNTDVNFNSYIFLPSVDALEEFKVQTGIYSAEFGRAAGQVNVVTKSGSNAFHGTVFEFHRNDKFDSHIYSFTPAQAAAPKPAFQWNQYRLHGGRPCGQEPRVLHVELRGLPGRQDVPQQLHGAHGGDAVGGFLGVRDPASRSGDLHRRRRRPELPDVPGQPHSGQPDSSHLAGPAGVLPGTERGGHDPELPRRGGSRDRPETVHPAHGLQPELGVELDGPVQLES